MARFQPLCVVDMCRYGYKIYKPHLVCFRCRKQFKKPPLEDYLTARFGVRRQVAWVFEPRWWHSWIESNTATTYGQVREEYHEAISTCPQCAGRLADLGLDFKPPRAADLKAWRRLESIYQLDFTWHTCGCWGPGFIPTNPAQLREFMKARAASFSARLQGVLSDAALSPERRATEAAHWEMLLTQVRRQMRNAQSSSRRGLG